MSSLGTYYVVMGRHFCDRYEEDPLEQTDAGYPCKIIDTDKELAERVAWEMSLEYLREQVELRDYSVRPTREEFQAALDTLPSELRAVGKPWESLQSWAKKKWTFPKNAPAAFYEALRPSLEGVFYFVEAVEM